MPRRAIIQFHVMHRNNAFRNNNNDIRYPLIHMRDHLFHVAFVRIALIYATVFSERARKVIEFFILTSSFLSLVLLSYIHVAFVQSPTNCLEHVQDKWPRDGILRVEILKEKLSGKYTLEKSYLRERKIKETEYIDLSYFFLSSEIDEDDNYKYLMELQDVFEVGHNSSDSPNYTDNQSSFNMSLDEELNSKAEATTLLPALAWTDEEYIMEFSLEYGFLKLSPSIRKKYNISVELVTLNPDVDKCFGGALNNFILQKFLGYDEVLLASLKLLASKEEYKGNKLSYVRNTLSEVEFVFVNAWMDKKAYITAGFVMMVFTISISVLLRYSHHQIFVFIVELLHMFEFQSSFNFPAGPLLTVILALVGMEAIMSEFFSDTAVAFYVILIVWMADQYDTICCKSPFTKKHWLRFFYLYHFFFYAYSYRFGHNRFLALLTSWLFTLHSMVYFFHRYELPILTSQDVRRHFGNPPPPPRSNEEASNNQSQDTSTNQFDAAGASDRSSNSVSTNPNTSDDNSVHQTNQSDENNSVQQINHPSEDNSVQYMNASDVSSVQQNNPGYYSSVQQTSQDTTCLIVPGNYEKNVSSSHQSLCVYNKCDKFSDCMHNISIASPKWKPKMKSNIANTLVKKIFKTTLINLKSLLILLLVLLFSSRTLNLILSIFLTKLCPYECSRVLRS